MYQQHIDGARVGPLCIGPLLTDRTRVGSLRIGPLQIERICVGSLHIGPLQMDGAHVGRHLETPRGALVFCGARIGRTSYELVLRKGMCAVRVCDDIEMAPTTCLFATQ